VRVERHGAGRRAAHADDRRPRRLQPARDADADAAAGSCDDDDPITQIHLAEEVDCAA
jgi:hypothetical protein